MLKYTISMYTPYDDCLYFIAMATAASGTHSHLSASHLDSLFTLYFHSLSYSLFPGQFFSFS